LKYLNQFVIPFSGLPEGEHWFDFKIEKEFFECFENSDVLEADVLLTVQLIKRSTMLELQFGFSGSVKIECDRCLGPVDLPLECDEKIFVKFGNGTYDEAAEVLVIPFGESEMDIGSIAYEIIYVALPMKRAHPDSECEEGAEEYISIEEEKEDKIDPRWEQLKNL